MKSALPGVLSAPLSDRSMDAFHAISYREDLHTYVTPAQAKYLGSPQYQLDIATVRGNPRYRAQLCIALLGHFALDPLADPVTDALMTDVLAPSVQADGYWVCLRLDRLVSFVGPFILPKDAPEVPLLRQAIQDNLAGPLFKAAAMYRRLQPVYSRIRSRLDRRASAASNDAYLAAYAKLNRGHGDPATAEERDRCSAAGDAAYEQIVGKQLACMDARIAAVSRASVCANYQAQGFIGLVARFAVQHLRPIAQQGLAQAVAPPTAA